ncbi:MAG: pyridoxamine 5'-phosphate oxidase family protein [Planctomycetota bacterium]
MSEPSTPHAARLLVEQATSGVLCTAHAEHGGWPFGSIVPYALSGDLDPIVWLSDLAEHTRNLRADPRASLFVADAAAAASPQAGGRACLMARARVAVGDERDAAQAAYFARFPEAAAMSSMHGFAFHVLAVEHVRWIAGFGAMGWLTRARWQG